MANTRVLLLLILLFLCEILATCGSGGSCGSSEGCPDVRIGCCPAKPVKCCDRSCPKCLGGGRAPRPGSGCKSGCPLAGCCPGDCPCDDCVCCYTTTTFKTATSTCYREVRSVVSRNITKTETETLNFLRTQVIPVTFSATESYLFTLTSVITEFATGPAIVERTLLTFNLISRSTIYFRTVSITELSTTSTAPVTTVTTNAVSSVSVFVSEAVSTIFISTRIPTTTLINTTRILTGNYTTVIFGSSFVVSDTVTFVQTLLVNTTLLLVPEFSTRPVFPITIDETVAATSSIVVALTTITSGYGTAVLTTVPGTWTFYQYSTPDGTKTLTIPIDGPPKTSTIIQTLTVGTSDVTETVTSNFCPTISVSQVTTQSVLATTTIATETEVFGTTAVITTIASTLVLG